MLSLEKVNGRMLLGFFFFLILRQTFARVKCFLMLSVDVEQIGLAQAWGLLIICCYTLVKLIVDENGSEL